MGFNDFSTGDREIIHSHPLAFTGTWCSSDNSDFAL